MKKKVYAKPTIEVENFIITDYVANCTGNLLSDTTSEDYIVASTMASKMECTIEAYLEVSQGEDCKNTFLGYATTFSFSS